MSKLLNQWIDLFRAGDYGDKGTFSAEDVQRMAASYKPAFHEAPIRIGHTDESTAPAYGWLESLRCVGDTLQGRFKQVVPAFAEAVEKGLFKKRSVALKDYGNGLSVRHVAFLGAVPPECKGLADIAFSQEDDSKDAIEIEFSEEQDMTATEQKTFNEQMKEFFQGIFGGGSKPEAKTFSETEVKQIAIDAAAAAVKPFDDRLKASETRFSERETSLSTVESQRRVEVAINHLKAKGAYVPAYDKMGVPQLFSELAKQPADVTIEFTEGDKKVKKTPLDVMVEFMEGLPKIVPGGKLAIAATPAAQAVSKGVNAGAFAVDDSSVRLHEATLQFAEEKNVGYIEAQAAVLKKNPGLARVGGASAGTV